MINRTKELRTIARRATGHASFLRHLQKLTDATDKEVERELSRCLADDLKDYQRGGQVKDQ